MKKIFYTINIIIIIISMTSCAGYKPIFSSSNVLFKINNYKIKDNKKLGNKINSKIYILSK